MKISVTAEDIKNGVPHDACNCPIAIAAKRKARCRVLVNLAYGGSINVMGKSHCRVFGMPPEAISFARAFDARLPVEPFEFEAEKG